MSWLQIFIKRILMFQMVYLFKKLCLMTVKQDSDELIGITEKKSYVHQYFRKQLH